MGIMGENFLDRHWPQTLSLWANTYMCGADASSGVQMASWETHKLSLAERWNALSLIQSHSLGVQMLSSQASQGLNEDLVILMVVELRGSARNQCQVWAAGPSAYSSQCHSRAQP